MKDPAEKLFVATIFYSLFKAVNNKQNIKNVLSTSVTYQNSNQSNIKHLPITQIYQEFNQLSFSSKVDVVGQYITQSMTEMSYKYSGSGEQSGQQSKQQCIEINNQNDLGFDVFGNEFHLFYPNILVIMTPNGQKLNYKSLEKYNNPVQFDDIVYDQEFLKQFQGAKQDNLNAILKKKHIFSDEEPIEQKMQIDIPADNILFYNFDCNAETPNYSEVKIDAKMIVEQLQLLIKNNQGTFQGNQAGLVQQLIDQLKQKQNSGEKLSQNDIENQQILSSIENQHDSQQALTEEESGQINQNLQQLQKMIALGLSYKQWQPSIIKYLGRQNYQTSTVQFVKFNIFQIDDPQILIDLTYEIQSKYIQLLQMKKLTYLHHFVTNQIIQNLKKLIPEYYNARLNDYKQLNIDVKECIVGLSKRTNFHTINLDTKHRDSPVLVVKKPINYKLGNLWILREMPIWLRDRQCLSKNNYVLDFMTYLGYDEPIYEEPKEEVYEPEDDKQLIFNQQRNYFQNQNYFQFANDQNLDTYQLDGFVVDDDQDDVDVKYSDDPAEMRKRQQRKLQRRQMRQQIRMAGQQAQFPRQLGDLQIQMMYGKQNTSQLELQQMRQNYYAQAYRQQAMAVNTQMCDYGLQNAQIVQPYRQHNVNFQQLQPMTMINNAYGQPQNSFQANIIKPELKIPDLPKIPLNLPSFKQNQQMQQYQQGNANQVQQQYQLQMQKPQNKGQFMQSSGQNMYGMQ